MLWRIGKLTIEGVVMGGPLLLFCTAVLAVGKFRMGFGIDALRTLAMAALVFGSEGTLYAIRERRSLWSSHPSLWVVVSTLCDILIISTLVLRGIFMAPLPILVVVEVLVAAVFALVLDFAKVPVFNRLKLS